jgi:hypothetical protein
VCDSPIARLQWGQNTKRYYAARLPVKEWQRQEIAANPLPRTGDDSRAQQPSTAIYSTAIARVEPGRFLQDDGAPLAARGSLVPRRRADGLDRNRDSEPD